MSLMASCVRLSAAALSVHGDLSEWCSARCPVPPPHHEVMCAHVLVSEYAHVCPVASSCLYTISNLRIDDFCGLDLLWQLPAV